MTRRQTAVWLFVLTVGCSSPQAVDRPSPSVPARDVSFSADTAPTASASQPLSVRPSAPLPATLSPPEPHVPPASFAPLPTLSPAAAADVQTRAVAIESAMRFGRIERQVLVQVENVGEAWAELLPEDSRWTAFLGDGTITRRGRFEDQAYPRVVAPGRSAYLWVDADGPEPSRVEVDVAWDNANQPAAIPVELHGSVDFHRRVGSD